MKPLIITTRLDFELADSEEQSDIVTVQIAPGISRTQVIYWLGKLRARLRRCEDFDYMWQLLDEEDEKKNAGQKDQCPILCGNEQETKQTDDRSATPSD